MDLKSLEALGITADELINRIVDKCVEQLMTDVNFDEDGDEWRGRSAIASQLDARIKKQIDDTVNALAERHILPNVSAYIENLTLQTTNQWGEKKGQKVTFIEYLTQRAEDYMQEKVNFEGKAKTEAGGYSWNGTQTRITHLVHQHLHYSIESAMKQALQIATSGIATGLQETCKAKLGEIAQQLKVEVKTR